MTRPQPDPAFRWSDEPWGAALRCRELDAVAQHLFTTKQLALRSPAGRGPAPAGSGAGYDGWILVAQSLAVAPGQIKRIRQVHGRAVHVWRHGDSRSEPAALPEADAQISNDPSLVLAVQVADCVPLLMADARRGTAAAIHAGWRGSAARIIEATLATLDREFGTRPADLVVAIGPSIGACCYQVGHELIPAFARGGATADELDRWFQRGADGGLRLDLWTASRDQLVGQGVPASRIFQAALCTQTHAEIFDSFRACGERAGRMAALIRVPTVTPHGV